MIAHNYMLVRVNFFQMFAGNYRKTVKILPYFQWKWRGVVYTIDLLTNSEFY